MNESISQLLAERGIAESLVIHNMCNVVEYFIFAFYFCLKYLKTTTPFYTLVTRERKEMCVKYTH